MTGRPEYPGSFLDMIVEGLLVLLPPAALLGPWAGSGRVFGYRILVVLLVGCAVTGWIYPAWVRRFSRAACAISPATGRRHCCKTQYGSSVPQSARQSAQCSFTQSLKSNYVFAESFCTPFVVLLHVRRQELHDKSLIASCESDGL